VSRLGQPPSLQLWEVELLHHFTIRVAETFDMTEVVHNVLRDQAVQEALRHGWLLHMVLIISSIHLALTDAIRFTEEHRALVASGCAEATACFRQEAENITQKNALAVRLFPFFTSTYAWALPHLNRDKANDGMVLDEMINILRIGRGNRTIQDQMDLVEQGVQPPSVTMDEAMDGMPPPPNDFDVEAVFDNLRSWIVSLDDEPRSRQANTAAAQTLAMTFEFKMPPNLRPMVWPNLVENDYVELLEQRNVTAMIIFAYYAIALEQCKSRWWIADWGARLVQAIAALLPPQCIAAIAYPLQKLGIKVVER
jgi:hypothetical protein